MRRQRMAAALAALALTTGAIAAGCGGDDEGGGGEVGELKVGVLVPLTGQLSPFGGPGARAAELAAAQVNAAAQEAGVNLNVTLVTEDTKTDPQGAQEAATKLIESDDVSAFAGPWASSETIGVAENVAVDAGVPVVTPSATLPEITDLEDEGLVFRTPPSDALQGRVLAEVMAEEIGADKTVVVAGRNDAYGTALVEEFANAWREGGGTIAATVAYNPNAASLDSEAGQIVRPNPDAWMIIDYPEAWAKMGPALVRTGDWDPARTFTGDGLRSNDLPSKVSRPATEGMRGTAPTSQDAPAGKAFDRLWKQEVKRPRQTYDAQNFDAVVLIALASAAAGSNDPGDIAENLQAVSSGGTKYTFEQLPEALTAAAAGEDIDYEGASGPVDWDDNGDPSSASYSTWVYRNGELVDSDEIIPVTGAE
jgi:ABC-type branched-subunit amino acid transport system substrate-binding protein